MKKKKDSCSKSIFILCCYAGVSILDKDWSLMILKFWHFDAVDSLEVSKNPIFSNFGDLIS